MSPVLLAEQVHGTEGDSVVELFPLIGHGEVVAQLSLFAFTDCGDHGLSRALDHWKSEAQTVPGRLQTALGGLQTARSALLHHVRGGVQAGDGARRARSMLALTSAPTTSVPASVRRRTGGR